MCTVQRSASLFALDDDLRTKIIATVRSSADKRVDDYLRSPCRKLSSLSAADVDSEVDPVPLIVSHLSF